MVSQADRELIQNFVLELQPYLETVDTAVREFAGPVPDGVVVGQGVQALSMIRGAGSVLMINGLVKISDLMSEAFEIMQQHPSLEPEERVQRLRGLLTALRDFLAAIDADEETSQIQLRAQTIFESIPRHDVSIAGTAQLGEREELDALFDGRAARASRTTDETPAAESFRFATHEQPTDRLPRERPSRNSRPTFPTALPAGQFWNQQGEPARIIPEQPEPEEVQTPVDPELREIFVEEAASLVVSFGENAKAIARRPGDFDAIVRLRRDAHTLKGAANMTGFPMIGKVASSIELLLDEHLERELPVSRETLELLVVCWKMLRAMLKRLDDLQVFRSPANSVVQRATTLRERLDQPVDTEIAAESPSTEESDEVVHVGHTPVSDQTPEHDEQDRVTESRPAMHDDLAPTDEIPVVTADVTESEPDQVGAADDVPTEATVGHEEPFWTPEHSKTSEPVVADAEDVDSIVAVEESSEPEIQLEHDEPAEVAWPEDEPAATEQPDYQLEDAQWAIDAAPEDDEPGTVAIPDEGDDFFTPVAEPDDEFSLAEPASTE